MARSPFDHLLASLRTAGATTSVTGASGGFTPLLLAAIQRDLGRPLVVVTPDRERAAEIRDGIELFSDRAKGALAPCVLVQATDSSPYHQIAPNRYLVMERLAALFRLANGPAVGVAVIPAEALAQRTLPRAMMGKLSDLVLAEETIDREAFLARLDESGYSRVPVVEDPGTFAVRGGLIDVFSPLYDRPVRIDLWGEVVESLRFFDTESQRGAERLTELLVAPVREVVLNAETLKFAREALRSQAGELELPAPQVRAILRELDERVWPLGVEGWLPGFYESPGAVADYLPAGALVVVLEPAKVREAVRAQREQAAAQFEETRAQGRLVFPPEALYAEVALAPALQVLGLATLEDLAGTRQIELKVEAHDDLRQELQAHRGEDHAFKPAASRIREWRKKGVTTVAVGSTDGQLERLRGLFGHYGLRSEAWPGAFSLARLEEVRAHPADVHLFRGELLHGFVFEPLSLSVLGDEDVLPHRQRAERRSRARAIAAATLASFRELGEGDLVVHIDHGIGRYDGLVKLAVGGVENDFLKLAYKDDALLYVPVQKLDRVQKYSAGEDAHPPLDRLGGKAWELTRQKAKKAAEDMARELLAVQAAREAKTGHAFSPGGEYYEEFAAAFTYDETPDQASAIAEVMGDMDKERPMDRLVCGDVGYGKTEVAMRAAMRAVLDQKQVAVLVPTTVLAEQHRITFEDRFRGYPVSVAALSRFRSPREEKDILERLASGRLDVVIGTHRLLQKDVRFKDLGLLVIDEEHRFGVKHKERIKQLRELVDVLTLTATPIPRTLNMALAGLRDMSIIATPPTNRLAVRTMVSRTSDDVIKEAIDRELKRSGQVYFVHNRVETIHRIAGQVKRLCPSARILVGHGQMGEEELERVMLAFMAGDADVLVCTTIIESGLDVPRANTMLIDRADTLGLAQLYQIRGRVGRSAERAYCYLLIPEPQNLTGLAEKRVAVIQRFSDLGSGFHIATMDMEIRGAGNLLGARQHGHVKDVGLDLFSELLGDAVRDLQGAEAQKARQISCEMKVGLSAFLPERYLPDVSLRLFFYKRIASARTTTELEDAFEDLVDRCGRPPEEAGNLFEVTKLKIAAQKLGIKTLTFQKGGLILALDALSPLAGKGVVQLLQRPGNRWKLTPDMELVRTVTDKEWEAGPPTAEAALLELMNGGWSRT